MDITADDVLAPRSSIEAPERDRAVEWPKEILEGVDSMPSKEISKLAAQEGFKEHTLRNAKKEAGIKSWIEYDDGNKTWYCRLPKTNGDKQRLPSLSEVLKNMPKMPSLK